MRRVGFSLLSVLLAWGMMVGVAPAPASAAFPGGNGLIAFQRGDTIQVVEADGSGLRELISHGYSPAWSPNGRRIAFAAHGIHVASARGRILAQLTTNPTDAGPSWSPSGKMLLFRRVTPKFRVVIMVVRLDGFPPVRLAFGTSPAWSPDGTKIAFDCGGAICTMNPDGSGIEQVSSYGFFDVSPDWSPDGSKIVFARYDTNTDYFFADIYTMEADGSNVTQVTSTPSRNEENPVWSPQGDMFAFNVANRTNTAQLIGIVGLDGSGYRTITKDSKVDAGPTWQPLQ